jgi:Protein of unknown function (DUF1800)
VLKIVKIFDMPKSFSRRAFLKLEKSKNTIVKEAWPLPRGILTGLDEYTGPWTATQAAHLIRRTMFGAKKAEIKSISAMKMTDAVDLLLQTPPTPAQPVNDYNDVNTDKLADKVVPFGQPWANLATRDIEIEFWKNVSLKCWWFNNIIEQKYSIQEKMLLFWQNHIPIQFFEVYDARHSYRYLSMLRQHSLGNFKSMVKAVTIDPAMLFYLNGHDNVKAAPDENYARELQELFCIGKGPEMCKPLHAYSRVGNLITINQTLPSIPTITIMAIKSFRLFMAIKSSKEYKVQMVVVQNSTKCWI